MSSVSMGKIRALCARVLKAEGEAFRAALEDLDEAITAHILASPGEGKATDAGKPPRDRSS